MTTVDLTRTDEIATLTLNNPDKLNAINLGMWQQLAENMAKIGADRSIRCVVMRGAGDEAFAAGGDLEEFVTARATLEQALHYHDQVAAALNAIADCPHPTVALIQGACIGGGLEIAGVCDLRISRRKRPLRRADQQARFLDVSRRNGRPAPSWPARR
jgi:enoyl-CoA hydratase